MFNLQKRGLNYTRKIRYNLKKSKSYKTKFPNSKLFVSNFNTKNSVIT